jgi:hypothetical protein
MGDLPVTTGIAAQIVKTARHPAALGALAVLGALLATVLVPSGDAGSRGARGENPCHTKRGKKRLLCPDLRMRPPFDLHRDRVGGRPVLRAANSINSVGRGPAMLRGRRTGTRAMRAKQWIRRKSGGVRAARTGARLYFKSIPGQGPYWKWRNAAEFSLFRLNRDGDRIERVAVGKKMIYCLRDLEHTRPGLPRSPNSRRFPACSQDPGQRRVTLGTSVGWSDVYPYSYHEQYITLNRIPKTGCYAFQHKADPNHHMFELKETNNAASTVVRLTKRGRYRPGRCRGVRDKALPARQTTDDSQVSSGDNPEYPRSYQPDAP